MEQTTNKMTSYLPYTGIGSRETPADIYKKMTEISKILDQKGYTLRSGGAEGADSAFEDSTENKEIFIPWTGFNHRETPYVGAGPKALELAEKLHPNWKGLKNPVKLLIGRNTYQVLGKNLDSPSKFVVCWTNDGAEYKGQVGISTGGTGTAIKLAAINNIPVINLKNGLSAWIKLGEVTGMNWFELLNI